MNLVRGADALRLAKGKTLREAAKEAREAKKKAPKEPGRSHIPCSSQTDTRTRRAIRHGVKVKCYAAIEAKRLKHRRKARRRTSAAPLA